MRWFIGVFAVCSLSAPALAETVDDVIKKLEDSFAKVKSFSMKMKMEQKSEGNSMDGKGALEFMRKDGKELSRTDMDMTSEMKSGDFEMKMVMKSQQISDGQFSYSLIEYLDGPQKGTKQAFKNVYQPQNTSPRYLKEMGDLKLLPDEKVDGAECYVIEVTLKQQPTTKNINYFRKADGIVAKAVTTDNGKQIGSMHMTDIKLNPDLAADRFVFKAPEGVQVQDMTGGSAPVTPTAPPAEKP
jgi:outer membrane lipoprotein-sorting protein